MDMIIGLAIIYIILMANAGMCVHGTFYERPYWQRIVMVLCWPVTLVVVFVVAMVCLILGIDW